VKVASGESHLLLVRLGHSRSFAGHGRAFAKSRRDESDTEQPERASQIHAQSLHVPDSHLRNDSDKISSRRVKLPVGEGSPLTHGDEPPRGTFDAAIVIAPPHHHTLQWSYTALSRSRSRTDLVLVTDAPREQPAEHATPIDALTTSDALARLATCLTRDELETARQSRTIQLAPTRSAPQHSPGR
jgi:hypothetical protein